ncbi:MAG TPA: imidazolonepropionase [Gemmatimonadaceae bacterium]
MRRIGMLATCAAEGGQGDIHPIANAALAWRDGRIVWVGPDAALPAEYAREEPIYLASSDTLVIPGLIDCHTHLAFGGWRANEFVERIQGRTYQEIAAAGGGIASTVEQTRATSSEALAAKCARFLAEMLSLGVTTVECKTGYGLTLAEELRLLRLYRDLAADGPQRLVPTLLGAHTVPPEMRDRRETYVDLVVNEMIPAAAREHLATCCDVFVERGAFTVDEARRILRAARDAGLAAKLHADQLSDSGGAALAAEMHAISADHLEHASDAGIAAMAQAGVVAVSLPFATLYLGQAPMPARRFIDAGVPVAVATDFNPGSAPSYHLPLALTLACTMQRMTPAEALKGATIYAARAVGLERDIGSLEPGKRADFASIDAPSVDQWLYHVRPNACSLTFIAGEEVYPSA